MASPVSTLPGDVQSSLSARSKVVEGWELRPCQDDDDAMTTPPATSSTTDALSSTGQPRVTAQPADRGAVPGRRASTAPTVSRKLSSQKFGQARRRRFCTASGGPIRQVSSVLNLRDRRVWVQSATSRSLGTELMCICEGHHLAASCRLGRFGSQLRILGPMEERIHHPLGFTLAPRQRQSPMFLFKPFRSADHGAFMFFFSLKFLKFKVLEYLRRRRVVHVHVSM